MVNAANDEKIVLIGGGHGPAVLIEPLKNMCSDLTAIITVSDDGGSSKILRQIFGMLAIGDLRHVMSAFIPNDEPALKELINYRFSEKKWSFLNKHALGNFILAALWKIHKGDMEQAVKTAMKLFHAGHTVLPVSNDSVMLCAELEDGVVIEGEGEIDTRKASDRRKIKRVFFKPLPKLLPAARQAIVTADKIVFCAGSFWTSLIPNLMVEGFREALQETRGKLIYVVNIMTNPNETRGWKASDHARKLLRYTGGRMMDVVICNTGHISEKQVDRYFNAGSTVVDVDLDELRLYTHNVEPGYFVDDHKSIRHSPALAKKIVSL